MSPSPSPSSPIPTPRPHRSDAVKVLERLEGSGISENIHEEMKDCRGCRAQDPPRRRARRAELRSRRARHDRRLQVGHFRRPACPDPQFRRAVAELKDIKGILGALHGEHTLPVRRVFEDTVLAVLRKGGDTGPVHRGDPREGLDHERRRAQEPLPRPRGFSGMKRSGPGSLRSTTRTATKPIRTTRSFAYPEWPDRSVLPDVEGLLANAPRVAQRVALERAFVRLSNPARTPTGDRPDPDVEKGLPNSPRIRTISAAFRFHRRVSFPETSPS